MSTTHAVFPSTHNADLPDYLNSVKHIELRAHLLKSFVNNVDFVIVNGVRTAWKILRTENMEIDYTTTDTEMIAGAVRELRLGEYSFFEAGSNNASIIDQIQHLNDLRDGWIEMALEANKLIVGGRSTIAALFMASNNLEWHPLTIEEQLDSPRFNASADQRERVRKLSIKTAKAYGKDDAAAEAKAKADLERLEQQNRDSERALRERAPIYCALFANILRTDVSALQITETRGLGHSTEGNPKRVVHHATRRFDTLPHATQLYFIQKSIDDALMYRQWQARRRMEPQEWALLDNTVDTVVDELRVVARSPKLKAASTA